MKIKDYLLIIMIVKNSRVLKLMIFSIITVQVVTKIRIRIRQRKIIKIIKVVH